MSIKILIVDDQPDIVDLLNAFFLQRDYAVATAENGAAAQAIAEDNAFDVALLDIMLPEMDGLELLEWFQENHPNTLVYMMTGLGYDEVLVEEAIRKGASGYFNKTSSIKSLEEEIRKSLKLTRNNE